jgi:hypothetical protein
VPFKFGGIDYHFILFFAFVFICVIFLGFLSLFLEIFLFDLCFLSLY